MLITSKKRYGDSPLKSRRAELVEQWNRRKAREVHEQNSTPENVLIEEFVDKTSEIIPTALV